MSAFGEGASVALLVLEVIGLWWIFVKAERPGWAALIPIYNLLVLVEILELSQWWVLWSLIPIVNIVFWFAVCQDLSDAFGYGMWMTLCLFLVPWLALPALGLGSRIFSTPEAPSIGAIHF